MSLAYSAQPSSNLHHALSTNLTSYLSEQHQNPMDRGAAEYSQSGLHSPYPAFSDPQSEGNSADQSSAAQYPPSQEVRSTSYSTSATPTSEYGINPSSARSDSFPAYLSRPGYPDGARYHHPNNHSGSGGDPAIAASSPTYASHNQYSPYPPQQDMSHGYPGHPGAPSMYQARPDWAAGYGAGAPHHGLPGHPYGGHAPASSVSAAPAPATAGGRPSQVYSFVPIPGAAQHKRPRRRYEEIERMYKCGWNGCEKAYGTLNHLNAHVTMQSHGQKRTPEEFKEIRKEWKARKKEEEAQRKAEEERQRNAAAQNNPVDTQNASETSPTTGGNYGQGGSRPQLPPIGYAPGGQVSGQYQAPAAGMQQPLQDYGNNNHIYSSYSPAPYGQQNQMQ